MTNLALVTAARVRVVESFEQMTLPTAEAVIAGQGVRIDTTTGKFTLANGSSAGEARIYGVAAESKAAGLALTAIRRGVMDGFALTAQAYDAAIYVSDTDGMLADSAGTASTVVGRVIPVSGVAMGAALDKLLLINL